MSRRPLVAGITLASALAVVLWWGRTPKPTEEIALPPDLSEEDRIAQAQARAWLPERVAPRRVPAGSPPPGAAPPPIARNLVLVIGCTLRRDQMGLYGGGAGTTPFLDQLGAEGVVFDDLIAATPWTKPAVTALLTGRHALGLGVADPGPGRNDRKLPLEATTLAEILDAAGHLTLGASANPNITATFDFDQGFDGYQFGLGAEWGDKTPGPVIVERLLEALDTHRADTPDAPFLLQAVVFDTHARRRAPPEEVAPFMDPALPERIEVYRAHLRRIDDAVARLHEGLHVRGLLDDTLFVFVGDHGEGMSWPHHHGPRHGLFFGSSTVHVPWILSGPGLPSGRRVLGTVSQVDVLPTLLSSLGIASPDGLDGTDLTAVVATPGAVAPDRVVFSDTWFAEGDRVAMFSRERACQLDLGGTPGTASAKGVPFVDGCTDRHEDPLALNPADPADGWRDVLTGWRTAQKRRAAGFAAQDAAVDAGLAAKLAALGYVDTPTDTDATR